MKEKADKIAEGEMYFKQIIALCDLMLDADNIEIENILTLRDLSEAGLKNFLS